MHYFVSDLHLRDRSEKNYSMFVSFLSSLNRDNAKNLFLVGDIFDLWVADHDCFVSSYKEVVDAIKALVAQGVRVHYFEGNHDLYLKKFWQDEIGCNVYQNELYIELEGKTFRVEHGDLANPEDKAYLRYRAVLRSPFLKWLAYRIPGKVIHTLGLKASKESRKSSGAKKKDIHAVLQRYVTSVFRDRPFDVFVGGHFHQHIDETLVVDGNEVRHINLGWWNNEQKVLVCENQRLFWKDAY